MPKKITEALSDVAVEKTVSRIGKLLADSLKEAEHHNFEDGYLVGQFGDSETGIYDNAILARNFIRWVADEVDPTPNSQYTAWLLKCWLGKNFRYIEDMYGAHDLLEVYNKAKPKLDIVHRDINRFKTYGDFEKFVDDVVSTVDITSNAEKDRETEKAFFQKGEAVIYLDTGDIKIVIPKTEEASCWFGRNTKWCTAAKHGNQFDNYNKRGKLYIVLFKKTNVRWQLQLDSGQFMNEKDNPLTVEQVKSVSHLFNNTVWAEAIERDPFIFKYIANPNEVLQHKAVEADPWMVQYIAEPTPQMIAMAKEKYGRMVTLSYNDNSSKITMDRHRVDRFTGAFFETLVDDAENTVNDDIGTRDPVSLYFSDIEEQAFARKLSECLKFQRECSELLDAAYEEGDLSDTRAGYYFYHVRVGSGVGFFDQDLGELDKKAKAYGSIETDVVVGVDGNTIYIY